MTMERILNIYLVMLLFLANALTTCILIATVDLDTVYHPAYLEPVLWIMNLLVHFIVINELDGEYDSDT